MPRIARVVRIVQTTVAAIILLGYFLAKILINIPSQSRVKSQWRIIAPGILHDLPGVVVPVCVASRRRSVSVGVGCGAGQAWPCPGTTKPPRGLESVPIFSVDMQTPKTVLLIFRGRAMHNHRKLPPQASYRGENLQF